jgi:hypothetical protein
MTNPGEVFFFPEKSYYLQARVRVPGETRQNSDAPSLMGLITLTKFAALLSAIAKSVS